ncbi:MAG TPA: ATP-binding protein, partial [Anaerolineae bacterium]|nr:ATP-binding protein [Anaerolineae bacterium]
PQEKMDAFKVGGVDYITKPFGIEEVLARIAIHLSLRQAQQRLQAQNAQLEQEVVERRQAEARLHILHELDQAILATPSSAAIATAAINRVRQLIPCRCASVIEITEERQAKVLAIEANSEVLLNVAMWETSLQDDLTPLSRLHNVPDLEALSQRSVLQERLYAQGVRAYLLVPLPFREQVLGALTLESLRPGTFTAEHVKIAVEIAVLLAVAIRQAGLHHALEQELAERRAAEKALRVSETALRQYTLELEASNAELDAFAHTVAHDLKNPLSAIVGFGGLLEKRYAEIAAEKVGEFLHIITQNAHKMTDIVDELLLLASVRRIETLEPGALDMAQIITEALSRLTVLQEETRAEVFMPKTWPVAQGYAPWVEEVWANYISNAFKYGGRSDEGIPPRVELGYSTLDFDSLASESEDEGTPNIHKSAFHITFWVRDDGMGLSSEQCAALFTEFTRLDQTEIAGHGLGLSIVKRIIEKLGGRVGVKSAVGKGSTFWFTLPAGE